MSAGKIVLRNTLFSYGRTLISAVLTLFSSRWVLADLGASDYGIYGLAGGLLFFVSFISSILSQGAGRHLAYATGKGAGDEVTKWFNVALNVFFCLPFLLLPIGWLIGEIMIRYVLHIETGRIIAALWVFRCSLLSFCAVLIATPYLSLLTSKQMIHIAASLMLCHSVALFIIAWCLPYFPSDHLIGYACFVACSYVFLHILYIVVCRKLCSDARVRFAYWWDWLKIKSLVGYSGWLCVGTIGTVVNSQGQGMLLNWMKGTAANAGAGIGSSLSGQMQTLSNAFLLAISPEVIRREGACSHETMLALARRSTRFGMMLLMLVAIPLFCECEYVLKLWLGSPPPYAVFFTRIAILSALCYKMAVGHRMCFQAIGRIRGQQLVELFVFAGAILVIGLAYCLSHSVYVSFSFAVAMQFVYFFVTAIVGSRYYQWPVWDAFYNIGLKSIGCFLCGQGVFFFAIKQILPADSFGRVCFTSGLMVAYVLSYFYLFVFTDDDRMIAASSLHKLRMKLKSN